MRRAWARVLSPAMERAVAAGAGPAILRAARAGGGIVEVGGTRYLARRARRMQRRGLRDLTEAP